MKKIFLTCMLTVCLLLASCVENSFVCASAKVSFKPATVTAADKKKIDWENAPRFDELSRRKRPEAGSSVYIKGGMRLWQRKESTI